VQPKKGDCSLICKHMREVICGGNIDQYLYLIALLTWKVQHPHLPTEVALVLRTDQEGTGKDTLFEVLRRIFGSHYRVAANPEHLFKWNAGLLANAAVVSLGELLWSGNHQYAGRFKEMITAPRIGTEAKFAHPGTTPNTAMYVISSNEDWVVPAGRDARRFFVPDVSSTRAGDTAYFNDLYKEIDGEGPAAFLHKLLSTSLGNWHPRNGVPQTESLKEQKLQSLDPVARWWRDCLDAGEVVYGIPTARETVISSSGWMAGPVVANKEKLRDAFLDWARARRLVDRKGITTAELFRQLRKYAPGATARAPGVGTRIGAQFANHATSVSDFEVALKRK
jgi:phage/plasmid-associated DNA primase